MKLVQIATINCKMNRYNKIKFIVKIKMSKNSSY